MNTYSIHKIVSTGKRGKLQITTMFEGKSVTRHIVNGVGRHPDDTLPKHYAVIQNIINTNRQEIAKRAEWLAEAENPKNKQKVDLDTMKAVAAGKQAFEIALNEAEVQLGILITNDPLQVRYVVGEDSE